RDGAEAMTTFLSGVATEPEVGRLPIMIDSCRWLVLEAGLKCVQGKGIVNSISLKEGEEVFLEQAGTIRDYGAGAVVMAFDEEGQATEVERRVAIFGRAHHPPVGGDGLPPADPIFHPHLPPGPPRAREHPEDANGVIHTQLP